MSKLHGSPFTARVLSDPVTLLDIPLDAPIGPLPVVPPARTHVRCTTGVLMTHVHLYRETFYVYSGK